MGLCPAASLAWSTELVQTCPVPRDMQVASHEGVLPAGARRVGEKPSHTIHSATASQCWELESHPARRQVLQPKPTPCCVADAAQTSCSCSKVGSTSSSKFCMCARMCIDTCIYSSVQAIYVHFTINLSYNEPHL